LSASVEVVEAAAATRLHLQLPFPVVVVEAVRHGLMFGIPPLILGLQSLIA
jgi:hypothetical protein